MGGMGDMDEEAKREYEEQIAALKIAMEQQS